MFALSSEEMLNRFFQDESVSDINVDSNDIHRIFDWIKNNFPEHALPPDNHPPLPPPPPPHPVSLEGGKPFRRMVIDLAEDDDVDDTLSITKESRQRLIRAIQLKADRDREKTPSTDDEFVKLSVRYQYIDNKKVYITAGNNSVVTAGDSNVFQNTAGGQSNLGQSSASNFQSAGESIGSIGLMQSLLFQSHKKRWEVIRFIAMKNIQIFCTHKFDLSDEGHMKKWMKVLGLDSDKQENYEPCLDYLNLLPRYNKSETNRPTILRNSYEMVAKWNEESLYDRVRGYLQRRLLTYYHCVYLKYYKFGNEEDELAPYFCIPMEEKLRKEAKLLPLHDTFTAAEFACEGDPEFKCVPFPDAGSSMDIDVDKQEFKVHSSELIRNTNRTGLYKKHTLDSIQVIMASEKHWKEKRNINSHQVDGKEAKQFIQMLEQEEFRKAVKLNPVDRDMIYLMKSQFRYLFGSGHGRFDDYDEQLQTYILPNVVDGNI